VICERIDQCNRREIPEVDLHKNTHLILDRGAKVTQWRKKAVFSTNDA
jgi:hypothetical protein